MLESFETKEECRKRTISDIEKTATGKKSKKLVQTQMDIKLIFPN